MLERENTELKAGSEMISQETHSQLLSEMRASHEEEIKQAVAKVTRVVQGSFTLNESEIFFFDL